MKSIHHHHYHHRRSEAGLTLVELVAVSLLIAILSLTLYRTLTGIIRSRESVMSSREATRTAQNVLSRLTRELTNLVPTVPLADPKSGKTGAGGSLSSGAKTDEGSERIRFVSAGAGQVVLDGGGSPTTVEVAYSLEQAKQEEEQKSEREPERFVLVREERPARPPGQSEEFQKGRVVRFPMASKVHSLSFRFFAKGKWQEQWSRTAKVRPEVVEITLVLPGEEGRLFYYRTAVAVGGQ